ncbi:hypothetical protein ACLOJK_012636 [Asimina triloba]
MTAVEVLTGKKSFGAGREADPINFDFPQRRNIFADAGTLACHVSLYAPRCSPFASAPYKFDGKSADGIRQGPSAPLSF